VGYFIIEIEEFRAQKQICTMDYFVLTVCLNFKDICWCFSVISL